MDYRPYIKIDYKDISSRPRVIVRRRRRLPLVLVLAAGLGLALAMLTSMTGAPLLPAPLPDALALSTAAAGPTRPRIVELDLPLPEDPVAGQAPDAPTTQPDAAAVAATETDPGSEDTAPLRVVVRKGDTLSAIFDRLDLDHGQLYEMLGNQAIRQRVRRLRPGQVLEFYPGTGKRFESLVYHMDETEFLRVEEDGGSFRSQVEKARLDRRVSTASATISSSLFLAGQEAGLSDNLIMELVGILGWDIDFALDIREGDHFTVLYEELYDQEGEKVGNGDIVAAEFVNQGRTVRALRYVNPEGIADYYSPDGHSMRKAFLRTPVKFSRISSKFSLGRFHPILNRIRAHKGVDYAAPIGTPIKVTGDGKVIFRGIKGGYGRVIVVQHGGKYSTLYGHMSRFASSVKVGSRVRQGQVIGYVG